MAKDKQAKLAAKEAKLAKAKQDRLQKINKKLVKQEARKSALQKALALAANPNKKADIKKKIEKVDAKINKLNEQKKKRPTSVVLKTWSKGLGKEANRIAWEKKNRISKDFVTIVIVAIILAVIFFAIDMIIITIRK